MRAPMYLTTTRSNAREGVNRPTRMAEEGARGQEFGTVKRHCKIKDLGTMRLLDQPTDRAVLDG